MILTNLNDPIILLRGITGQQHPEAATAGLGLTMGQLLQKVTSAGR